MNVRRGRIKKKMDKVTDGRPNEAIKGYEDQVGSSLVTRHKHRADSLLTATNLFSALSLGVRCWIEQKNPQVTGDSTQQFNIPPSAVLTIL